ncbi:serine/threonine-protein phosphatase [Crocinitomicaceae bacterium]|jgi:sigma-B regulation protein RsbU (phosphoserine phosphatase)|nr:serine/threonine-protein phosphatase [Flavobacteriales bacterium]MDB4340190.1 serine/threonine-protein phosphatase [Crocinitomicaceae bacterium]MDC1266779.1 serine/threonine-protein phosphatase [Crocinitomicaceae bacterium]MDC3308780.1 serine/threonine-protein phosphatase [Crocinitomicaceae bacterium]
MYTTREQDLVYQNEVKEIKLRSLLEITNAINENAPVEHLMKIFTFILKEQLGFSKFVLLMNQKSWENPVKIGYKGKINLNTIDEEFNRFKEITIIESSKSKLLHQFQVIIPVFHSEKPLAFLLLASNLDSENETSYFSFVQTLTNIIAVAVENKRLGEQHIIKERISKELEVAREMQKLLFPSDLPSNRKMDISAKYIPRHAIGGDYYDFIPLGDNEYIICIADVSGKGVSAALLMANFQATIRTLFKYQRFEMPFLLEELNKKVMRSAKGEKFITFFIAHYNAYTRKMQYVNAGHNHPFILNGRKVMMLDKGCIGLGMLDEIPSINVGNIELEPNSTFVLYTDGLIELENTEGEFFGVPLLVKTAQSYAALKMEDMNNIIFSKLDDWREELNFVDDTAIFSCKFF